MLLLQLLSILQAPVRTNGNVLSNRVVPICEAGCHCYGSEGNCPAYPTITETMLPTFRELNLVNPLEIRCNPFQLPGCVSTLEEGEACVVNLIAPDTTVEASCPSGHSYRLTTVPSLEDAIAAGQYITHTGACGTCSSLQDLALMIEYPNLPYKAQQCFFRSSALKNMEEAITCYQEVGFTLTCSTTLAYHQKTIVDKDCGYQCATWAYDGDLGRPSCEDISGCGSCVDSFGIGARLELIAGRTFPNSGYPSQKAQNCSDIAPIDVIGGSDICAEAPLQQPPTKDPLQTKAPTPPIVPQTATPTVKTTQSPTLAPVQIATKEPTKSPTGTPTVSPVETTAAPVEPTAAPVEATAKPFFLITAFPTPTQAPLPISDLSFQQCLNTAAIEVRMGALAGGDGVVCDCIEAETGVSNRPRCFSSADRSADTQCNIGHDACNDDSDCCSTGVRKCRGGSCRTASQAGSRNRLRLAGNRGGAARERTAVDEVYRRGRVRRRA